MRLKEATIILTEYQAWRRGADIEMVDPTRLDEAIDVCLINLNYIIGKICTTGDEADEICERFLIGENVTLSDLKGKRGRKRVSDIRARAMVALKEETDMSLQEIGDYMGGRHYSTVIHASKKLRGEQLTTNN